MLRKIDAQLTYYMHIPHPEQLADATYWEKWEQLKWIRAQEHKHGGI